MTGANTINNMLDSINPSSQGVLAFSGSDTENVNLSTYNLNNSVIGAATGSATFSGGLTPAGGNPRTYAWAAEAAR